MRGGRWLLFVALAGCTDGGGGGGPAGELRVAIVVEEGGDPMLDALQLRVEEVVFGGDGPEGESSVSVSSGALLTLLGGGPSDALPVVDLPVGVFDRVIVAVHLRADDAHPALAARGATDETAITLRLDEVTLRAEESELVIDRGAQTVTFVLEPDQWLDGIDLEELQEDEGEPIVFDADTNADERDRIAENVAESAHADFPLGADD